MLNPAPGQEVVFAFMMVDRFSMIAFASAVEPLRLANRALGRSAYRWSVLSVDGEPVAASNGIAIPADGTYDKAHNAAAVFVCAGSNVNQVDTQILATRLRGLASRGLTLGGICTGAYVLARAGLLSRHRCTIHWENYDALREEYPDLRLTQELFEMDRSRWTCAGGTSGIDMMLSVISFLNGEAVMQQVLDQLIHHRMRESHERQRMELRSRLGIAHPKLISILGEMERHIEEPLTCAALAHQAGLTTRQVERLFQSYLNDMPMHYYLGLRLDRARQLLKQTSISIVSVSLACGFASASHFSSCYRERFSHSPSHERRMP